MQDGNEDTREIPQTRNLRIQNVRRRLFFDETDTDRQGERRGLDDNQTNEFFEEARSNLEKAKERWNFDFENETPLPGNYEWVKLDNQVNDPVWGTERGAAATDNEERKKTDESSVSEENTEGESSRTESE